MVKMIVLANSYDAMLGQLEAGQTYDVPQELADRWKATGFGQFAPEATAEETAAAEPEQAAAEPEQAAANPPKASRKT